MQLDQLTTPSGTTLQGPLLITPQAFGDDRGWFYESWNQRKFDDAVGESVLFSQDNHSRSIQGVLRGLHYQLAPEPQAKLVRASAGAIFDVAVDLRQSSPTLGQWVGAELNAENKAQLWVPEGFAHGFLVLSESADVTYRCTDYYSPDDEHTILWSDKEIGIEWPLGRSEPILSERDRSGKLLHLSPHFS